MKSSAAQSLSLLLGFFFLGVAFTANAGGKDKVLQNKSNGTPAASCALLPESVRGFQSNIFQNATGRVSVIFIKHDAEPLELTVADASNQTLFREEIREDSVRQNFVMRDLEPGAYRFTLSKDGECFTKTVFVK